MYDRRIKVFIILSATLLLVCICRLAWMQLAPDSSIQEAIAELRLRQSESLQLKTIRGKILDRKGRTLATDQPQFHLHISYQLSRLFDERVRKAELLRAESKTTPNFSLTEFREELDAGLEQMKQIIEKCTYFGFERADIEQKITTINDRIWNLRLFLAWVRSGADEAIIKEYNGRINTIPLSEAMEDFARKTPGESDRLLLISKVDDIQELNNTYPLFELRTDDDVFTAQLEFMGIEGMEIRPQAQRFYPYGSVAAQTIGWVGSATGSYKELFADDRLASYLEDDICGKRPGVEYVCETILRGRRGELIYDIDKELTGRTETRFGSDVILTIDVELQKKIEEHLSDSTLNPNYRLPTAAVILDVPTGDILALLSMPTFDLNSVRSNYRDLTRKRDPNEPLRNRAINKQYPPGSVVKPLILIAGLESGKITAEETISCPALNAPTGWPNCWIFNQFGIGHDSQWENNARNAVRGSCNIYFSRLADRIESHILQQWLLVFGYGREILPAPEAIRGSEYERDFLQQHGNISTPSTRSDPAVANMPALADWDKRLFGIGQGNIRATPLQVANAMAAIARRGIYKNPRLFIEYPNKSSLESPNTQTVNGSEIDLGVKPQILDVVYDGMSAVVNKSGGTAYNTFAPANFSARGIKVYGKTGSTERPDNAWFGGFVRDNADHCIAIAVVVEQGQSGSRDAAPLAREIIQFCIESGYLAQTTNPGE